MNSLHVAFAVLVLALTALVGLGVHVVQEHAGAPMNSMSTYDAETGAYSVSVSRG